MCSKRDMAEGDMVRLVTPTVCDSAARHGIPGGFRGALAAIVAIACGLGGGCGGPGNETTTTPPPVAAPAPAAPLQPSPPVTLRLIDHAGLMREVASHIGKVVVLDCWSTSCPPCVKEFPGLVALAERHGDRVVCLSLAFDFDGSGQPEELMPPITRFLAGVGAGRVTNLLSSEPADDLYRKLDLASVPAVYIWKPTGERAIRFDDDMAARDLGRPFTYEDVEQTVAALLAE
jgi:thiol-disulfide isomerase/thioredoxin